MDTETLAYAAGLLDAEGCIHIALLQPSKANRRTTPRYDLFLKVSNTHLPVLEWLRNHFGGAVVDHHNRNKTHKQAWHWQCSGKTAQDCLRLIHPYLKIKRQQAILAIEFQDFNQSTLFRCEQEMTDVREAYRQKINSALVVKESWTSNITNDTANIAYAAAFFDGEGSVLILAEKRRDEGAKHRMRVKIPNTDHDIIKWLHATFPGGHVNQEPVSNKAKRDAWTWRLNGSYAQNFLIRIHPFLIIKKEQASIAIEFEEYLHTLGYGSNRIKETVEKCESYRIRISALNKPLGHITISLSAD